MTAQEVNALLDELREGYDHHHEVMLKIPTQYGFRYGGSYSTESRSTAATQRLPSDAGSSPES